MSGGAVVYTSVIGEDGTVVIPDHIEGVLELVLYLGDKKYSAEVELWTIDIKKIVVIDGAGFIEFSSDAHLHEYRRFAFSQLADVYHKLISNAIKLKMYWPIRGFQSHLNQCVN